MLRTTAGSLLVNSALPEKLRKYDRVLDGNGIRALMKQVAEEYPDQYRPITKALSDIGRRVSYASGGFSFGLKSLRDAPVFHGIKKQIESEIDQIMSSDASDDDKQKQILLAVGQHQKPLEEAIYRDSLADGNPLAEQVLSGSRGKPMNLKSLRGADLLYQDHRDQTIPVPVLNSYSKGLTPAQYFAGSFGARRGTISTKMATAQAGFFGKQLNQAAHRLIVTAHDAPPGDQVYAMRGMPVDTDDNDNEGSLLAQSAGGYPRNTPLTSRVLGELKGQGIKRLLIRSPILGGPPQGGLYGRDVGVRERGGISPLGDQVGIAAAAAISEPVSQGGLSEKHSGGVAGASSSRSVSGFKALNQLTQVPKEFPGGAAHADIDGRVGQILDAPAGGQYVMIDGKKHFVPRGLDLKVKSGDEVEAGDILSEGLPNPAKVVEHKGIGEGRRYFMQTFRQAMKDAGMSGHRRNLELVARGLINHVRLTDEMGEYVPDDVVPYDQLEHSWQARPGTQKLAPKSALGKYLEVPTLHYSIGSRVSRGMLKDLAEFNVPSIDVHDDPPPFQPEMIRGMENLQHDPDWQTRMLGSNLEKSFLHGVHTGAKSNPLGTSYVPALVNPVNFGRQGLVHGFDPKSIKTGSILDNQTGSVLDGL